MTEIYHIDFEIVIEARNIELVITDIYKNREKQKKNTDPGAKAEYNFHNKQN